MIKNKPLFTAYLISGIGLLVALTLFGFLYGRQDTLLKDFIDETTERRSQSCDLFEGQHLDDVKELRRTYKYIEALEPEEISSTLNQFVIRGLPELEDDARNDPAPEYCDDPNIGLPEPDPNLPPKRDYRDLLIK